MTDPQTQAEYERLYIANHRISGYGIETTQHFPCPFCAHPDWWAVRIIDFALPELEGSYTSEAIRCEQCGRSARHAGARQGGSVTMSLEQTDGPDPPEWVPIPRAASATLQPKPIKTRGEG